MKRETSRRRHPLLRGIMRSAIWWISLQLIVIGIAAKRKKVKNRKFYYVMRCSVTTLARHLAVNLYEKRNCLANGFIKADNNVVKFFELVKHWQIICSETIKKIQKKGNFSRFCSQKF